MNVAALRIAVLSRNVQLVYRRQEAARALSISDFALKELIDAGEIGTITQGRRTYVTGWHLLEYLEAKMEGSKARQRAR